MLTIHITLQSDATFGRGDGVAGLVDAEVEYDLETGLPYLRGRTLKGLLVEECSHLMYALECSSPSSDLMRSLDTAARTLFGKPGSLQEDTGSLHVGSACLPDDLSAALLAEVAQKRLTTNDVLETLTTIRRQTSVDEVTGAPEKNSLRSMRVVLRRTEWTAPLSFQTPPNTVQCALLGACVAGLRRGGTGRNRGRGRLTAQLQEATDQGEKVWGVDDFERLFAATTVAPQGEEANG